LSDFNYVSLTDRSWVCIVCDADVPSEQSTGFFDHQAGRPVLIFTPASRYWLPGSKPSMTKGVFCSAVCASNYHGGEVGPSGIAGGPEGPTGPRANNENPEGL